jgi:hypothetical protein
MSQATDTTPANLTADLAVSKSSTPTPYVPGQPQTYTVIVTNSGPSDAMASSYTTRYRQHSVPLRGGI